VGGVGLLLPGSCGKSNMTTIAPPVEFRLTVDENRRLSYTIQRGETPIIKASPLGLILDNHTWKPVSSPVVLLESGRFENSFSRRGNKTRGAVSGKETIYRIGEGKESWRLQVRTFFDGVAWRYLYPIRGSGRLQGELTAFTLPKMTGVWAMYQTKNYEGWIYRMVMGKNGLPDPPEREDSQTLGLPLTFQLPDQTYGSILIAGAPNYPALTLLPVPGTNRLRVVFEGNPEIRESEGDIVSSWWIVLTGPTLNDLVQSDILPSLAAPPPAGSLS